MMFEFFVMDSHGRTVPRNRLAALPLSVAVHALVIVSAVVFHTWAIEFPENSPNQPMQRFASVTPPPPPPAARRSIDTSASRPVPQQQKQPIPEVTPATIPDAIPELSPPLAPAGDPDGVEGSSADGEPGGVPGGVAGGVASEFSGPFEVGGDVTAPVVLDAPAPEYPEALLNDLVEGLVGLELVVDRDGRIVSIRVLSSTNSDFNASAVEGVGRWKFAPGRRSGKPVDAIFRLGLKFQIPDADTVKARRGKRRR